MARRRAATKRTAGQARGGKDDLHRTLPCRPFGVPNSLGRNHGVYTKTQQLCSAHSPCIGREESHAPRCHSEGKPRTRQARRRAVRRLLLLGPPGTSPSAPVSSGTAKSLRGNGVRTTPRPWARRCDSLLLAEWKAPAGVVGNGLTNVACASESSTVTVACTYLPTRALWQSFQFTLQCPVRYRRRLPFALRSPVLCGTGHVGEWKILGLKFRPGFPQLEPGGRNASIIRSAIPASPLERTPTAHAVANREEHPRIHGSQHPDHCLHELPFV